MWECSREGTGLQDAWIVGVLHQAACPHVASQCFQRPANVQLASDWLPGKQSNVGYKGR